MGWQVFGAGANRHCVIKGNHGWYSRISCQSLGAPMEWYGVVHSVGWQLVFSRLGGFCDVCDEGSAEPIEGAVEGPITWETQCLEASFAVIFAKRCGQSPPPESLLIGRSIHNPSPFKGDSACGKARPADHGTISCPYITCECWLHCVCKFFVLNVSQLVSTPWLLPWRPSDGGTLPSSKKKMDVDSIFQFFQTAHRTKVSSVKLAEIRQQDSQGGVRVGTVGYWQRKLVALYLQRARVAFAGTQRVCIAADASRHSALDYQVSLAYSPERKIGCYFLPQYISSSKVVYPDEFPMLPEVERVCARREQERLKAMRFLQSLSGQLKHLCGYELADLISPDEEIHTGMLDRPMVHLIMDQGSVGCSAAAFLMHLGARVHFAFDKIHRLLRDVKQPMSAALQEVVMTCTYIFNVNFKPNRSCAFYDEKVHLLEGFLQSESCVPWLVYLLIFLEDSVC